MKKMMLLAVLMLVAVSAKAQTVTSTPPEVGSISDLLSWAKSQFANTGLAFDLRGGKYSSSSWDLASYGQSGINVGKSAALDFLDFGPEISIPIQPLPGSVVPDATTRYGWELQIHAGNIWNSIKLPSKLADHVFLKSLPNATVGFIFLIPDHQPINKWKWRPDSQLAVAYRF